MAANTPNQCATCKFWGWPGTNRVTTPKSVCRRFPPAFHGNVERARHVMVERKDWCGEWARVARMPEGV